MEKASDRGHQMVAVIDGLPADDPAVRQAVQRAAARVARVAGVTEVTTAYDNDDPILRAVDGRASPMVITTAKTDDMMVMHQEVGDVRDALVGSVPGATVKVGGELAVIATAP